MSRLTITISLLIIVTSCRNNSDSLNPENITAVRDSVQSMAASIAKTVSQEGPTAWLKYFENTPEFFMASDGQLAFPNIDTAKNFINTVLVKNIRTIDLHWSDLRIDPLTTNVASIAAVFHEDITDSGGKKMPFDGYFTGVAHQSAEGWKLYNAHWSIRKAP